VSLVFNCRTFDYEKNGKKYEADLAIIFSESLRDDVKVVFGEAKSSGDIDEDEKSKLLSLSDDTGAILAFCTQSHQFSDDDKRFFQQLVESGKQLILLTGSQLEMDFSGVLEHSSAHRTTIDRVTTLSWASMIEVLGKDFTIT
jgi:hypothetical protein